jgi:5,10-methylene-tetrahydrofolate dehydrogenase/methenyl tetrahydrofolate cyclohydrolase
MSTVIDGKTIAAEIRAEIKIRVDKLQQESGVTPGLAVILVGSRRDSQTYVNMKTKACAAAGISSIGYDFNDTVDEATLLETVQTLNANDSIHGILIQLPLPKHLNEEKILQTVDPRKDVDGLHPTNIALLQLYKGEATKAPFSIPCTPLGCLVLLDRSGVNLTGKNCVVLGRSHLVGLPMARLLLGRDATVTIVHSKTQDAPQIVKQADVVVAAVGKAGLVTSDWLKPGAVVIDVGINSVDIVPTKPGGKTYKLAGDVDYESAKQVCSMITPVPGGVGPMTIAMLLNNTLASCERTVHDKSHDQSLFAMHRIA